MAGVSRLRIYTLFGRGTPLRRAKLTLNKELYISCHGMRVLPVAENKSVP